VTDGQGGTASGSFVLIQQDNQSSETDTIAPTVVSATPNGLEGVVIGTNIEAVMSESGTYDMSLSNGAGVVSGQLGYSGDNKLVFDPDSDLEYDTSYTYSITGSDDAGNALVQYDGSFRTTLSAGSILDTMIQTIIDNAEEYGITNLVVSDNVKVDLGNGPIVCDKLAQYDCDGHFCQLGLINPDSDEEENRVGLYPGVTPYFLIVETPMSETAAKTVILIAVNDYHSNL